MNKTGLTICMQINKQINCALHADKKLEKREREKERNSNDFRLTFFFVMVFPQGTVFKNANKSVCVGGGMSSTYKRFTTS